MDEATKQAYEVNLDDVPGIFALMDPMPGALEAVHKPYKADSCKKVDWMKDSSLKVCGSGFCVSLAGGGVPLDAALRSCGQRVPLDAALCSCEQGVPLDAALRSCGQRVPLDAALCSCEQEVPLDAALCSCEQEVPLDADASRGMVQRTRE